MRATVRLAPYETLRYRVHIVRLETDTKPTPPRLLSILPIVHNDAVEVDEAIGSIKERPYMYRIDGHCSQTIKYGLRVLQDLGLANQRLPHKRHVARRRTSWGTVAKSDTFRSRVSCIFVRGVAIFPPRKLALSLNPNNKKRCNPLT